MTTPPRKAQSASRTDGRGGLKIELDDLARRFGPGRSFSDPVRFPRRYVDPRDSEAAALLAALFAYGNVTSMGDFLERLLGDLGPSPYRTLTEGPLPRQVPLYRFQTGAETARLLRGVGAVLKRHGSLEAAFCSAGGDAEARLEHLAALLRREVRPLTPGLAHLLPLPSGGSACKRWWLFMRWVVRPDDGLDLGLWTCVKPSELRVPVDTHLARIAYALGLTRRRTPDRAFSIEVTESLARFCPEDPTRYDFAIAHLGISRACRGKLVEEVCSACSLRPHCILGRKRGG